MTATDTSEAGLERLICTALTGGPCDPPKSGQAGEVAEAMPSYEGAGWICSRDDAGHDASEETEA